MADVSTQTQTSICLLGFLCWFSQSSSFTLGCLTVTFLPGSHPPLLLLVLAFKLLPFYVSHIPNFPRHLHRLVWEILKENVHALKFNVNYLPVCMPSNMLFLQFFCDKLHKIPSVL